MPSRERMRRCSSDCGFHPSVAATTNRQASTAPTPGQHVADEADVAGHVHERQLPPRRQRRPGEAEVDGETPGLFLGEAVRVDAGEGEDQRRLAVIDVAGGGDDVHQSGAEGLGHHGVVVGVDRPQVEHGARRRGPGPRSADPGAAGRRCGRLRGGRRRRGSTDRAATPRRAMLTQCTGVPDAEGLGPLPAGVSTGVVAMAQKGMASPSPAQVGEGGGVEGFEHQAPGPQGPGEGVAGAAVDQVAAAGDDAGLRAAEQLVAGEGDQGGAGGQGLAGRRLARPARRAGRRSATGWWRRAGRNRCRRPPAVRGRPAASTATVSVKPTIR